MSKPLDHQLSRRERQIMDVLFQHGEASAVDIRRGLPDAPSDSAVRTLLRILVTEGHVQHQQDGPRDLYRPTVGRERAKRSALKRLVNTFFDGSPENAMAALLDDSVPSERLDRFEALIQAARERETKS